MAVAIVRTPQGCSASGATWFANEDRAVLLLSFRFLSDDQFWFSFFHEAGHLLLHGKARLFVEGMTVNCDENEEREADEFAAQTLIPPEHQSEFLCLPLNGRAVMRFARKIDIAPGIVVGQLQHLGRFTYRQLNELKRRYAWNDQPRKG